MGDVEYFGRSQVGTISTPALGQGEVGGTSHITNAASRSRPRKGRMPGMGSPTAISSPLALGDGHEAILKASGLGRRMPDQLSKGEQMSDADQPTQVVERLPDGSFIHHRRVSNGSVNSNRIGSGPNPLDDYEHLDYDPMPANLGELQQRLGVPSIFSAEDVA